MSRFKCLDDQKWKVFFINSKMLVTGFLEIIRSIVTKNVKDSLRNGIWKDEIESCPELDKEKHIKKIKSNDLKPRFAKEIILENCLSVIFMLVFLYVFCLRSLM